MTSVNSCCKSNRNEKLDHFTQLKVKKERRKNGKKQRKRKKEQELIFIERYFIEWKFLRGK